MGVGQAVTGPGLGSLDTQGVHPLSPRPSDRRDAQYGFWGLLEGRTELPGVLTLLLGSHLLQTAGRAHQ